MKRRILCLTVLLCAALAVPSFALEAGTVTWNGYAIEITGVDEGGIFAPAGMTEDEYCISVEMKIDEALWQDEALLHEMYGEALLADPEGGTYAPQVALTGTSDPVLTYMYAIPRDVAIADLTAAFGGAAEEAPAGAYTWGDMTFELTEITEDLGEWGSQIGTPEGKWVMAVFTVTAGEMELSELEAKAVTGEGVLLDGTAAGALTAQGVRVSDDMKAYAMGVINVFFDVPADLDITQAELTVNG